MACSPSWTTSTPWQSSALSTAAYAEALARIESAAIARGKRLGTAPHPGYPLEALIARGHRLITLGADMPLIRMAMTAQLDSARARS